jgi:hypothetical protein
LADNEFSAVNVKVKNFTEQISVYLSNASLLSKSLAHQGIKFTLLTNNADKLNHHALGVNQKLNIKEIKTETSIPSGTKFFSAHYKVEVFRYISKWSGSYAIFCDLDVVCLRPLPSVFKNISKLGTPLIYDVTDQIIPVDGHDVMIQTFESINKIASEGRWLGGEFIAGTPQFFEILTNQIDEILPTYFSLIETKQIKTQGNDEVYTTAAIERLNRTGNHISDAGQMNVIGRFWSSGTKHIQKPFTHFESMFLLHLPADKYFLKKMDSKTIEFNPDNFLKDYKKYILKKKIISLPRAFLYLLFRIKSKTVIIRSLTIKSK